MHLSCILHFGAIFHPLWCIYHASSTLVPFFIHFGAFIMHPPLWCHFFIHFGCIYHASSTLVPFFHSLWLHLSCIVHFHAIFSSTFGAFIIIHFHVFFFNLLIWCIFHHNFFHLFIHFRAIFSIYFGAFTICFGAIFKIHCGTFFIYFDAFFIHLGAIFSSTLKLLHPFFGIFIYLCAFVINFGGVKLQ